MMIKILITGGTIDKQYDTINGQLVFQEPRMEELVKQSRCTLPLSMEKVMLVDSLHMSDDDRQAILKKCESLEEEKIIVTHGTDTMVETARLLGGSVRGKTVVLFGAMVPHAFGDSDALFNFGTAVAAVQAMPHGVYITMNGMIFPWDKVRKDRGRGVFERIDA